MFPSRVELVAKNLTGKELEFSQQQFNIHPTSIQHPSIVESEENAQTVDRTINTETQEFIQQITKDNGERVGVEQVQFNDVLQNEQQVDLPTTQEETPSQTNSLDPISQQEALNQKYQPVEVLNSQGEWVKGYWVHKCIMAATAPSSSSLCAANRTQVPRPDELTILLMDS